MSVFYSLSEKVLIEIDYTQVQFNNISHPIELTTDGNEVSSVLSNTNSSTSSTNNPTNQVVVNDKTNLKAVLDENNAYYYPDLDPDVITKVLPTNNVGLNYIAIRFHILAGYNFQELEGLLFSMWAKTKSGKKVYLVRQFFNKRDVNRYKYNEVAKNIGDLYYDKYVEFFVIDYSDIIANGVNGAYFADKINFASEPVIFATYSEVEKTDYAGGYLRIHEVEQKNISFSANDQFPALSAFIQENTKGYIEYCAKWNGGSIDSLIYAANQNGNSYYIIHELEVYRQVGMSLVKTDILTQIQTDNYDQLKKLRPIVGNDTNGGIKVVYSVRLFNKNNGDSIIKTSTLSISNISPYLEDIQKINIQQTENPIKVYNKIISDKPQAATSGNKSFTKVLVPIYINAFNVVVEDGYTLKVSPFDNFYEIKIFKSSDTGVHIMQIDSNAFHKLAFKKQNGSIISVDEIVVPEKRKYGSLTFKITSETAKLISANGISEYSIITENGGITTKLTGGSLIIE